MKKNQPLVSVAIPCYNHEQFVQESIQSVIDQDYENIELIIIDDGSKDSSVKKIQEMIPACKDRFVKFDFRSRPNKGLCATLNEALEWCEGEYFSPIASDDILLPYKISTQITFFKNTSNSSIVGVFSKISTFSDKKPFHRNIRSLKSREYCFNDILLRKSKLPAPSVMIKKNSIISIGGYDVTMTVDDLYMWLRLTENGNKLAFIDQVLVLYRRHSENLSKKHKIILSGVLNIIARYKNHPAYREAISRSYLVHAGDLAENKNIYAFKYFLKAIICFPRIITSRLVLVFFYRTILGVLNVK